MNRWPKIQEIDANCLTLPAFIDAAPLKQKDA